MQPSVKSKKGTPFVKAIGLKTVIVYVTRIQRLTYAVPISNCSCLNVKLPSQDEVNCSHVTVAFLLQSLRTIDICISISQHDEESDEGETKIDDCSGDGFGSQDMAFGDLASTTRNLKQAIKSIKGNLASALSLDVSATIDLSPPKVAFLNKYSMICQNDTPSKSDDQSDKPTPVNNSIIKEQLKLMANQFQELRDYSALQAEIPWLRCMFPTEEELEMKELSEMVNNFVDPAVYACIFALGFLWNAVLIVIFICEKDLWTPPNVMVFNLALADMISLLWHVAFFCYEIHMTQVIDTNENFCVYHVIGRPMCIALVALSVGALSILRYVGIVHNPNKVKQTRTRFFLYNLILWFLALCLAYPYVYMVKYTPGYCDKYGNRELSKILITSEFVVYFGVLPPVMIVFNTLTASKLKQSVRELPTPLKEKGQGAARHRSANMLIVFMSIFLLTCVPHYVLRLIRFWNIPCNWKLVHYWLYKVSYYPLFSNHCLNPISLYFMSGTFRAHYRTYFLCLFRNSRQECKS